MKSVIALHQPSITVDARMWQHSGIGRYLRELLPRLLRNNPHWDWCLLTQPQQQVDVAEHLSLAGVDVACRRLIACPVRPLSLRDQLDFYRYLPDMNGLYWAPHFNVPFWYRGALLVTIHDVLPLAYPEYMQYRLQTVYVQRLCRKIRRQARAILFNSHFTAQEFTRLVGKPMGRTLVTPLGVGAAWQPKSTVPTSDDLQQATGSAVKKNASTEQNFAFPYVLYCGNVKPHKNLRNLLLAWQQYTGAHRLIVVGRYAELAYADQEAQQLALQLGDRVIWMDSVTDTQLIALMQEAELLVMPSFYEGFGLSALEAMAVGTPVLASSIGALQEICADAAQYCDPESPKNILQKLVWLLSNGAELARMKRQGILQARKYRWEECAALTEVAIRQALSDLSPARHLTVNS